MITFSLELLPYSPEDWGLGSTDSEKTKNDVGSWMAWLSLTLLPLFPSMLKWPLDWSVSNICFILAKNLRPKEEHKTLAQLYAVCEGNWHVCAAGDGHGGPCTPGSWSPSCEGVVSLTCMFVYVCFLTSKQRHKSTGMIVLSWHRERIALGRI